MKNCPQISDTDRGALFDALEALPATTGYTLKVNTDCSYSLSISGKRGHRDMPSMSVRGGVKAVIADAQEYLNMLVALGRMPQPASQADIAVMRDTLEWLNRFDEERS